MQKSLLVWKLIGRSLQENIPVMLLYVLESKGSSPGRQGFFMAVNAMGEMEGSIGGGIMEHKFVEMAREKVSDGRSAAGPDSYRVRRQVHNKEEAADRSGMICSGEQTILLYPVTQRDAESIRALIVSMEANKNGSLHLSPEGLSFSSSVPATNYQFFMESEHRWEYTEKTGHKNQLFIIGGGHCALAFSRLMREMDFYITLYEERAGLNTLEKNEFAHERIIVDDYTGLGNMIPPGPNQYVVIMTFGYRTDDVALRALLGKRFSYIGVLGSRKKMEKLFEEYRRDGIAEDFLQHIHSPVGLDINSRTPEEIAVSIGAEIIRVKNG